MTVERLVGKSTEVTNTRYGCREKAIQELVHPVATKGDLCSDRHVLAKLEVRDRVLCLCGHRLLAGDHLQLLDGVGKKLRIGDRISHPTIDRDHLETGSLHDVRIAELLHQDRDHLLAVLRPKAGSDCFDSGIDLAHLAAAVATLRSPSLACLLVAGLLVLLFLLFSHCSSLMRRLTSPMPDLLSAGAARRRGS